MYSLNFPNVGKSDRLKLKVPVYLIFVMSMSGWTIYLITRMKLMNFEMMSVLTLSSGILCVGF